MRSNMFIHGTSIIWGISEVALTASCIVTLLYGILEKFRGITHLLFITFVSLLLFSPEAHSQNKWYSTSSRGGGEGAKAQAQISALNGAAIEQRASLTTIEDCGNQGMLFGPGHAGANGSGCIPALQIVDDGRVDLSGALKLGDYTLCDASLEGTLRYAPTQKILLLCDGTSWVEVGAAPAANGTFTAVNGAQRSTQYTSNQVTVSGFFGTRTGTVTNGANILVNNIAKGASAEIKEGDSIALRMTSAGTYDTTKSTNFTLGSLIAGWSITTVGAPCNLPWGGSINDGQNVSAFQSSSVGCGGSCNSQIRTCSNGSLSGSYTYASCSVGSCCVANMGQPCNCGSCGCGTIGCDGSCQNDPYGTCNDACFTADTVISMADGTTKLIQDVRIGDRLLGMGGAHNEVLSFRHHDARAGSKIYAINGGRDFVTADHPFLTTHGWKSIDPEFTKRSSPNMDVGELKVGDVLVKGDGVRETVTRISATVLKEDTTVYHFVMSDNHTYIADGFVVHDYSESIRQASWSAGWRRAMLSRDR